MKASSRVEAAAREARRSPRQRALLRARITYSHGAISLDCLVLQISAVGAKVNIREDVALPEVLQIEIPQRQIFSRARIVRRDPDAAAIAFEAESPEEETTVTALRERVRVLEAENKMLRASYSALAAQLDRSQASY